MWQDLLHHFDFCGAQAVCLLGCMCFLQSNTCCTHTYLQELTRSSLTTVSNNSSFPLSQGWKYLKPCEKKKKKFYYINMFKRLYICFYMCLIPPVMIRAKPCHSGSAAASSSAPSLVSVTQRRKLHKYTRQNSTLDYFPHSWPISPPPPCNPTGHHPSLVS